MKIHELLVGQECPECGYEIDGGSLRFEGHAWTHKHQEFPQAGHHTFDVVEAMAARPLDPGFTPIEVREYPGGELVLIGEMQITADEAAEVERAD